MSQSPEARTRARAAGVSFDDLSGGGRAGALIRSLDWSATPLGPSASWPRSLASYLSMILQLPTAAIIFWGPERVQIYNDGYSVIMGPRHPRYLGRTFAECWPEAYEAIDPWMQRVLQKGETVEVNRTLVPLTRHGFTEEAYFTFSFSPLRDDEGRIGGILQLVTEVTDAVLGERRAGVLHALSNQTARAKTTEDAVRLAETALEGGRADLPFSVIYALDVEDRERDRRRPWFVLAGATGLPAGSPSFPKTIDPREAGGVLPELAAIVRERRPMRIEGLAARLGEGAWPEMPSRALASPILSADQQSVVAILVVGVSEGLALDGGHEAFVQLVSAQLGTLLGAARAYDEEKRRADALAEIDRTKTEFFGNVSHELRTPLTLILGPLEDALAHPSRVIGGDALEAIHRSAVRLLKLVNSLLDFARVEAGRLLSSLEPTDLSALTAGLAGSFQSLLESAGLALRVDCPPLSGPVNVDRAQWEKIVLNLVSNAYKFTFRGAISVALRELDDHVELSVSDTGIGIPADELPKLFQRFHRVEGARGRSFEGTGIGLALVQELVKQHGGDVRVDSAPGVGSTFVVSIPKRAADARAARAPRAPDAVPRDATPFVLEASRWSAEAPESPGASPAIAPPPLERPPTASAPRILVVDDNADMREYVAGLLAPRWTVETAEDGRAALEAVSRSAPDLILSDVMMPRLDGVALVNALRAAPATRAIPIVLLSARAGEEAVVGGLETGADDYLVKPFSARELLARVRMHLAMARLRREWAGELERANKELESFSYSVSHDLRTPLRAIDGFTKVLLEDYGPRLDEQAGHYLRRVRAAAQRMAQLIDDLLDLSRIGRAPLARARVDLAEVVARIVSDLREREPGRAVEVVVAGGLVVDADPRLVRILLENLLGNAWKFTAKRPDARIEIGHERREGAHVLFVRDNGVGFDMAYVSRLFAPFQRLHADSEFPGTGIGLATVARIVSRHGGRISAESAEGRGATFTFTLGGFDDDA